MTAELYDQPARDAIVNHHDHNLFVDAGAGSGKTKQLVDRVVAMVATGYLDSVSGLAAITFTENAATELRTRIREALEDAADERSGRPADERTRCDAALQALDDAAITTLHGFASRLLADAPLEAGLPPGFRVQDAVRSSIDRDAWWRSLLDDWYDDDTLAEVWRTGLTLDLNPSYLKEVLDSFDGNWDLLLDNPITVAALPSLDADAILDPLRNLIDYAGGRGPEGDTLTERIDELLTPLLLEASGEEDPLQVLAIMRGASLRGAGYADAWSRVGLSKATASGYLDAARDARDAQLTACREAVTTALCERLRVAVLAHAEQRRDKGELWFHDLLVYAVRLLRRDGEIRAAMRDRWQVICVDEFQDTDPLQVELVHLIAGVDEGEWRDADIDGGRLFFVGDPKQSIYRFRRAEVGLFAQVRDLYGDRVLGLVQNFRSRPAIINVVNAAFTELLRDDVVIGYQPLRAARPDVPDDPGPDVLLLGGPSDARIGEIREVEADHVAATLARARGSWLVAENGESPRSATFGDMAILVPTRTSLGQLEDALDRYGVPYRTMSRSLIWESDAVRDLVTVLRAIDDPADPVALVAALRHPMFACSDDDLVAWKVADGAWHYGVQPPAGMEDSPVAQAMAALRRYHDLRWWLPVNVLLDRIVRERRAVELTAAHRRPRDHWRRLRFLVDQARLFLDSGGAGVTAFVRWAQEQIDSAADAIETVTPERDDDAVQILTIHGAKGLEFPIVALTGINSQPRTGGHVMWPANGPPEITLYKEFKTTGYNDAHRDDKVLDRAEGLRLLYVGMTRAAEHLVVSLHHHPPNSGTPDTHAMRLYQLLGELSGAGAEYEPDAEPVETPPAHLTSPKVVSLEDRQRFLARRENRLAAAFRSVPTTATGLVAAAADVDASQEPADALGDVPTESADARPPRPVARSGATLGSAVHRALEILDLTAATEEAVERAVAAACAELGATRLAREVRNRVASALIAPMVQQAVTHRHWKEVPIIAEIDGRIVEGFIDLVVETPDGLVVVDYKTDAARSESEQAAKVTHYGPQIRAYGSALATATGRPVRSLHLLFLGPATATAVDVPHETSQ